MEALEALAIHSEHRRRDAAQALEFTLAALARAEEQLAHAPSLARFSRRAARLQKKLARAAATRALPL